MEAKSPALEDAVDWFLDDLRVQKGAGQHTIEAYQRDLAAFCRAFQAAGVHSWSHLSQNHILDAMGTVLQGLKPSSTQRKLSSLRSFLKFAARNGVAQVVFPDVGGFSRPKRLPKALPADRREEVLGAIAADSPVRMRDQALFELIYGCGLRVSEAVNLSLAEVDLIESVLRVTGKREKTRLVPIPEQTRGVLQRYLAESRPKLLKKGSDRVFLSDRGKPLLRQTAYALLRRYATAAGWDRPIGPHTLRHTYAVDLLKGGADLRTVQELLGHQSVETTQVYTELDLEEVRSRYVRAHPRA
jgi:integrase/recombinase XerD